MMGSYESDFKQLDAGELKAKRKKCKMTQKELAAYLGVTTNTVARWEQGVHRINRLTSIGIRRLMEHYSYQNK